MVLIHTVLKRSSSVFQFAGQLNAAHQAGFDAAGNAGAALFTGAAAATLTVAALTPDQVAAADATSSNGNMLGFGAMRGADDPESLWSGHLAAQRSEEHTSELQPLMRIPYAFFR